ncbi:hypothetical protein V499_08289 [Pseudogymnoascus sp. VKM F-103]|nr:hypothetical protein V499_08289 [Pseudogymnoascus sp. VKM F-103]
MEYTQRATWSPHLVFCTIIVCLTFTVRASDGCAPSTWQPGEFEGQQPSDPTASSNSGSSVSTVEANPTISPVTISSLITTGDIDPGQVNSKRYGIYVETFFKLNPGLQLDCGNIQADTDYCVRGFIEPLRATDGLCGPPNKNATCLEKTVHQELATKGHVQETRHTLQQANVGNKMATVVVLEYGAIAVM